jgi:hypothetical protein
VAGVLVPVSVVAAAGGNLLLVGSAHRLSASRVVAVVPALTWLVIVVAAMFRRPEGDLVITGGGVAGVVNLVFLLVGVTGAAFGVGLALAGRRPRSAPPAVDRAL